MGKASSVSTDLHEVLDMVVVGKHFDMFAYCGLVGDPHLIAIFPFFLLPFQCQPSLNPPLNLQLATDHSTQ